MISKVIIFKKNSSRGNKGLNNFIFVLQKKDKDKRKKKFIEDTKKLESITDINTDLIIVKTELENLTKEKLQDHIIRSTCKVGRRRCKTYQIFLQFFLETRTFSNKTTKKVEFDENQIIYDQSKILQQIKIFYENLYTCKDSELFDANIAEFIKISDIPKLDKNTAESLECIVSEKDILSALKNMKNTKHQGVTFKFFKFFWNDLKSYMMSAIQCIFEQKDLPILQRLGKISCFPNVDNPRQF